eukprot:scaffold92107_cov17-Prasinocladus_malaysianus.AAC.1
MNLLRSPKPLISFILKLSVSQSWHSSLNEWQATAALCGTNRYRYALIYVKGRRASMRRGWVFGVVEGPGGRRGRPVGP